MCKGSKHQGEITGGGRQCCCVALVFVSSITPQNTTDVDRFLELGTSLSQNRCRHGGYMLTQELEGEVELDNKTIMGNPISGTVLQRQDNEDALILTLESAVSKVLKETSKFFCQLEIHRGQQ